MARFRLDPPAGLDADDTTFAAKGRWADANFARFRKSKPQSCGGWEAVFSAKLNGVCRRVLAWVDFAGVANMAFGHHAGLQVQKDSVLSDITPVGFVAGNIDGTGGAGFGTGAYGVGAYGVPSAADYFALTWSLANLGQSLIANPRGQGIYKWNNDPTVKAAIIPNAPAKVTFTLVTPQGQIMALGCSEETSGVFNAMLIRTSDLDDGLGTAPTPAYQVWNTASSNLAREYTSIKVGSRIVAGYVVGDYVVIFTDAAAYLGTFTGDATTPWTFTLIATECGLIGPNAAVSPSGAQRIYWFSPDGQFRAYALGGEPQTLPCPIRDDLNANRAAVQSDKLHMASIGAFDECWLFYPDARDGIENSRAVFFNRLSGDWSRALLPRTAFVDQGATAFPVGVTAAGDCFYQEKGTSANGAALSWAWETADQGFDNNQTRMRVNTIYPDFSDQAGPVWVSLITRENPQAPEKLHGPYAFAPGQSKKDVRGVEGRLIRCRIEGKSSPSYARGGAMSFEVDPAGMR